MNHVVVPSYAVIDKDAAGSCHTALNALVNTSPNGTTFEFPVDDRYKVDGTFLIAWRSGDVFEFNNSELWTDVVGDVTVRATRSRAHVRVNSCDGVELLGLRITGPAGASPRYASSLEGQHGVDINSSSNVFIDDYEAVSVWGDGVYVGRNGYTKAVSRNVEVQNFHVGWTGRDVLAVGGGIGVSMHNGWCSGIGRTVFDLEPPGTQGIAADIHLHHVTMGRHQLGVLAALGGGVVERVTMEDIKASGQPLSGRVGVSSLDGGRRADFTIRRCTSNEEAGSSLGAVFVFNDTNNVSVSEITQAFEPRRRMTIARFIDCTGELLVDGVPQVSEVSAGTV